MNEVGGSESGTGLRAVKASRSSDANFEYDDSEWDVGIGNLIIDLDADIEKTTEANRTNNNTGGQPPPEPNPNSTPPPSSQASSPEGSSSSSPQMHIPLTSSSGSNSKAKSSTSSTKSTDSPVMEHSAVVDKGLKMKIKRTKTGTKSDAKHEIVKSDVVGASSSSNGTTSNSSFNKNSSDPPPKNSHSHKDKDKLVSKEATHDNSHDNPVKSPSTDPATPSAKVKTPRKGSTKEKKVKNSLTSKKDEKTDAPAKPPSKDKEFFTTVNLNVPSVIPNSSSSAFVKATATIKVPAPNNPLTGNSLHPTPSTDSSSNCRLSTNSSSSWSSSPTKGEKGRVSPNVAGEKGTFKKSRNFSNDKAGANQNLDENSTGSHSSSSSNAYRNQGALSINSATDLSTSSSTFIQSGSGSQPGSSGSSSSSSKETGKAGRSASTSSSSSAPATQDVCVGTSVGTVTEPDCLGPCEPGTSVTLEGIVWHETESGVLVVNVTWRGKTYVGTLLDCTKNDWAPPRFCDSPTSDLEMRTPKNRGKRGRANAATPVNEQAATDTRSGNAKLRNGAKGRRGSNNAAAFVAPASPLKSDSWPKRKTRGSETESQDESNPKSVKRPKVSKEDRKERRSNSPAADDKSGPTSPQRIECPEPNCSKKYKNLNGLKYHQSHAHANKFVAAEDSDSNMSTASTTNASGHQDQTNSSGDNSEPMNVDEIVDCGTGGPQDDSVSAPSTPGKKSTTTPSKVDDKIYDLSSDADLNPGKDSPGQDGPEPYSSKVKSKSKDDQDSKLGPENLSKDQTSSPTLNPRTPILTVPTVPYMSLQRNMAHGHLVNVPRVDSDKNSQSSKGAPWQPHAQSSRTSPNASSITVPLNIPMNIPEKLGKDKDKNNSSPESSSKKNKHKKKSKDKDREKSKDKERDKGLNVPIPGQPSDFSRSGLFHTNLGSDSLRSSKDLSSSDENDSSRKNSLDNRDDPQSPAYSDISDANDSGPDGELNVGGSIKDGNCKGLVIPGGNEIKKDPIPGGPSVPSYFNHGFHSPYLDSLSYAAQQRQKDSPDGRGPSDEADKNRSGPIKPPSNSANPSGPPEDGRPSPKMDYHSKYPANPYSYPFSYPPYSSFQPYNDHPSFPHNTIPNENFSPSGSRMMMPMEEKGGSGKKHGEKEESPSTVQIKQEPVDRDERRKEKSQTSAFAMNVDQDKAIEIKSEFGEHERERDREPKTVPPFMSSKHKEHKRSSDDRHERRERDRHDDKERDRDRDRDAKSDNMKGSSRNSSSEKSKRPEESEPKERKDEGSKPTMETTGPPPPPTASAYYLPQSYLPGNPFGIPFDSGHPLYRQMFVPGQYPGPPYLHPGQIPRFPSPGGPTQLPEDLSRPGPGGPPTSKALDLLQHHAAQYYNSHKIHELQERALKSPSPQVVRPPDGRDGPGLPPSSSPGHPLGGPGINPSGRSSVGSSGSGGMPKPADLSKDTKPTIGPGGSLLPGVPTSDNVRTPPPTQHHVHSHTHHHTHVGIGPIGYPIIPSIPAVSPQYSPHYGVLATPPAASSVIPPFPPPKPS